MLIYINDHEQSALNDRISKWHENLIIESRHVKYKKYLHFAQRLFLFSQPSKKL
jgi:hypothetical protein